MLTASLLSLTAAQAAAVTSEADYLTDMPIVLSVSRLPQRLDETPGAVTILDREMIRLSGARDVADLMRLVPGFQSSSSFERIAPQASYHGAFTSYSNQLQVLVDGRSVYSPYFVGSTEAGLQTVALEDIERIEVLRGSNSAAYGARAMLGVINIVTRHTTDTLGVSVGVTNGQNGIRDARASIGWGQPDASFRLGVDRRGDDGLAGANGHNEINRVNFRADLRPNARDEVQLRFGGLGINAGKGATQIVRMTLCANKSTTQVMCKLIGNAFWGLMRTWHFISHMAKSLTRKGSHWSWVRIHLNITPQGDQSAMCWLFSIQLDMT